MEMAMKMDEPNMAPRELTLGELDDVSAGIVPLAAAACFLAFEVGFAGGLWIARKILE